MTGGGLEKKGVDHELFLTKKEGGAPKNIGSEGGSSYFVIVGENLTCNDYCEGSKFNSCSWQNSQF